MASRGGGVAAAAPPSFPIPRRLEKRRLRRLQPAGCCMEPPEALREFQGLVERLGGRQRLLLVGEARDGEPQQPARALLETFARDLFAEQGSKSAGDCLREEKPPAVAVARRVRVRVGSGRGERRWLSCPLLFVLFRASSLLLQEPSWRRERPRLREILRDVRSQLPSRRAAGAPPVVVGVVVVQAAAAPELPADRQSHCAPERDAEQEEDARLRLLEALLHQVFPERRREEGRPGLQDTLQAAAYVPGGPRGAAEVRAAACRALRAALKLQADRAQVKKMQLPAFLQCVPWGRRSWKRKGHSGEAANHSNDDSLQDPEEGVALTHMAPNGEL